MSRTRCCPSAPAAPPPLPARSSPLRFDVPSPFALAMISPVVVSMIRVVIATLALPFAVPTLPTPYLLPHPPPLKLLLLFSVPNFVTDPVTTYRAPSSLPICATVFALGSARSLCARSCSAMMASSCFRSITRKLPVVDELVDEHVGDARADVLVAAPPLLNRTKLEVEHRNGRPSWTERRAAD